MRAAAFDIETTDLAGVGAGFILCAVVQPLNGDARVFRLNEKPGKERKLVAALLKELFKYDLLIGHNIVNFDFPFILTRALRLNVALPNAPAPLAYDTLHAFKRTKLRTTLNAVGKPRASLSHIVDLLGIKQEKTALYPAEHWSIVWDGSKAAMKDLVDHCVKDVRMTVEVYQKLLPLDNKVVLRRF